jgi:hypothetical protein
MLKRLLLFAILAGLASSCRKVEAPEGVLKVLTWNTFNLPTIAGEQGQVNLDEKERGRLVAKLLKRSGYQVIALNEVFDETVRAALIEEAESGPDAFRFVVEDLDGGGMEDSGLVLLSRLEPIRFTAPEPTSGQHHFQYKVPGFAKPYPGTDDYLDTRSCAAMDVWWKGQPNGGEVDSWVPGASANCLIAFHRYRACTSEAPDGFNLGIGAECDAGKGVGYVRLRQANGQALDVFWSHTQASLRPPEYSEPPNFLTKREGQLKELAGMVKQWSPMGERDAVIMGDLNVNGDKELEDEYKKLIQTGPDSLLGGIGFRDLWAESAPKDDRGLTWSHRNDHVPSNTPQERLDYVLWRDRKGDDMCAQHPFVERKFDALRPSGATIDLSDHFGVGVELRPRDRDPNGASVEPCSPSRARTVESLLPSAEMKGALRSPGACHWLRVEPGTWTVTSYTSDPVRISAWLADDISEEISFFRGDAELGHVEKKDEAQVAVDKGFYLTVCWLDPNRTGDYRIKIAPNVGADPEHPVVLSLNRFSKVAFGNQYGMNPTNLLWTLVQLPKTFSKAPHALDSVMLAHQSKVRVGTAQVGSSPPPVTWIAGFDGVWGLKPAGGFGGATETEMFFVIEREPPANPAQGLALDFRVITDHQEVQLKVLECIEQEDATGDDRVRMTYSADGKVLKIIDLGDFDEGQDVNLSGHTQLGLNWVKGDVTITIFDQDGSDLENDVTSGNALDNLGTIVIKKLDGVPPANPQVNNDNGKFTQDGANYRLAHRRRR